jgi:hypothetical protein
MCKFLRLRSSQRGKHDGMGEDRRPGGVCKAASFRA